MQFAKIGTDMKQIKPASIARIHTHECFTFLMDVSDFLRFIPEEGKTDKLSQAIGRMDETFQAFDRSIHAEAGPSGTMLACEADAACLKSWRNLRAFVEALAEHPDPETKAAARKARHIIREQKDAARVSRAERNVICSIIAYNLREMPEESIQMMGLEAWLADLEKKIRLFEEADKLRISQTTQWVPNEVQLTRQKAIQAYRDLAALVNALAMTSPEPLYDAFIDRLNTKADEVSSLLKLRSTLRQKSEEKTAGGASSEKPSAANA